MKENNKEIESLGVKSTLSALVILVTPISDWSNDLKLVCFGSFLSRLVSYKPKESILADVEKCLLSLYHEISFLLPNEDRKAVLSMIRMLEIFIQFSDQETLRAVLSQILSGIKTSINNKE